MIDETNMIDETTKQQITNMKIKVAELTTQLAARTAEVKELGTQLATRVAEVEKLQVARYGWNRRKARRLARQMAAG